jgi:hypothetical protein
MKNAIIIVVILLCVISGTQSFAYYSEHDASVLYWHEIKEGKHYYYYHVINNSTTSVIVSVRVGYNRLNGTPELYAPRLDTTHIPLEFISPSGWSGRIEYYEESHYYNLEWESSASTYDIKVDKDNYRFGVVLSNQRDDHINTHFSIIFGDSTAVSKTLSSDSEPPPPNSTMAPIYHLLLSQGIDVHVIRLSSTKKKS